MENSQIQESPDLLLGEEFLTWLWFQSDTIPDSFSLADGSPFRLYMEQRIVVEGGQGEAKETTAVSGVLSPLREARFGLATGKKVRRALIRLEKDDLAFQFSMDAATFRPSGLKTPKLDKEENEDPDALVLEKIFLLETCMDCFDAAFNKYLKLRLSADWAKIVQQIDRWIKSPD